MPPVAAVGHNKKARKFEEELEALGIDPPKRLDHKTIQEAVDLYLADMAQNAIRDTSKARRMLTRLCDFANARGVVLLKDVTPLLLTEWRSVWKFKLDRSSAVHWSVVKTFFKWAFSIDLISADQSANLIHCLATVPKSCHSGSLACRAWMPPN
jgi:hypothetical protein